MKLSDLSKVFDKKTMLIIILGIAVVFLGCLNVNSCKDRKKQKTEFLTDTVGQIKAKDGTKYIIKKVPVIVKDSQLKEYADSLYKDNERLKKMKQKAIVITKTDTKTEIKNVSVPTYVTKYPGYYLMSWKYGKTYDSRNYVSLNGITKADSLMKNVTTTISDFTVASDLILDVTDNDANTVKILARSDNPLLTITNVEGSLINPKKSKTISSYFKPKRWGIGFNIGEGVGYYGKNGSFILSPYIGIGISYNLINF